MTLKIAVLDKDTYHNKILEKNLSANFKLYFFSESYNFNKFILNEPPDVIILSNNILDISVEEIKNHLDEFNYSNTKILYFSDEFNIDDVIKKIKVGIYYYFFKPVKINHLISVLEDIYNLLAAAKKEALKNPVLPSIDKDKIVGKSKIIKNIKERIQLCLNNDLTVLISGPTGSGKDLIAYNIFKNAEVENKNFVKISCSTLPRNLIDNELFGHFKGSYTGAYYNKIGLFESGQDGTIYIDEIDSLPVELQAKFLRILEDKSFYKIGSDKPTKIKCRFIISLSKDVNYEIAKNNFRQDLFYRIKILEINTHYLKEYIEDIEELIEYFNDYYSRKYNKDKIKFSKESIQYLKSYSWKGNVRELENLIYKLILTKNTGNENLKEVIEKELNETSSMRSIDYIKVGQTLEDVEKLLISKTLEYTNDRIQPAANLLKTTYKTLSFKIKKYNLKK